jgi:transposase
MELTANQLNTATFIGIDAHPDSHTALAINRFNEPQGHLTFENTRQGITKFQQWLTELEQQKKIVIIGIEGGSTARNTLVRNVLVTHECLFEVNPLYMKHRRSFGTKGDKTDLRDAKLIASVLTTELKDPPKITAQQVSSAMLRLKKAVWYYEEVTVQGARIQNQLHKLRREHTLTQDSLEKQLLGKIIRNRETELVHAKKIKAGIEKEFKALFPDHGVNLTSIRGIGTITAARIIAHSGGIERFPNRDAYVRYAGIAPLARNSGNNTNFFVRAKRGNRKLSSVFFYAVLNRIIHDSSCRALYQKKIASGKTKMAAVTYLMRKTAILAYSMLKSGEEYQGEEHSR